MRKMKDSGIEWIGMIPEGWEVCRLKNIVACHDELRKPISADKRENHLKLYDYYGASGVIDTIDDYNVDGTVLLIGEDGANLKLRNLPLIYRASGKFWVNNHAHILIVNKKHSYDYVAYLLEAGDYSNYITGSAQPKLSQFNLMRFPVAIPNYAEQENISFFIHRECSKIDSILSETRSSIEEYKKLKQAIITQAVTKGVRGKREMKNCNIGWIKELPADWGTIPSKYLFKNSDTKKCNGDEQLTASQQHGIITQKYYTELTGSKVVLANKGLDDWKHVEPFDFIISLRSFQGGLEMSETTGCITWHYIVLKPCHQIYSYYYKWLFKSEIYIRALQRTCNFIRDGQDLRYSNFVQVPLFEPPLEEQKEIADYLNVKCAEIDGLIVKKELLVKELESYKKSLIYEVVTGKREV